MHTTAKQPSENASATKPANEPTAEEVLAQLKTILRIKRLESEVTMIAAQTKALESLMACMTPIKSTGDPKLDNFYARERNRQRLAAIQTLLHIRTVQREKRLRRAMRAKAKAKAVRTAKGGVVRSEADGHVDNGSTAPSPQRERRWSCADSAQDRLRGRPESPNHHPLEGATGGSPASAGPHQPELHADNTSPTNLTEPEDPTAPHWRTSRQWHPKPPKPFPAPSRNSPAARLIAAAGSTTGLTNTARTRRPATPHSA
ncbi:MAG: hypothetical protein ABL309_00200 [Phycisphaerales bacterium]